MAVALPGCGGHFTLVRRGFPSDKSVPLYYFKLVDSKLVADHSFHELADDAAARIEAVRLARSLRETRPELRGLHYSVWATTADGAGVCLIPLDAN